MENQIRHGHVLPKQRILVGGGSAQIGIGQRDSPDSLAVNVIKNGTLIQAIEITCPCGKSVRLLCEYDQ